LLDQAGSASLKDAWKEGIDDGAVLELVPGY